MKVKNGIDSSNWLRGDAEDALGQRLQQDEIEVPERDRKEAEAQAHEGQRERDRIAEQQENDQPRKHQRAP